MLDKKVLFAEKQAFIFELDNVIYPEQDYLLQVYYLFANFLEYTETRPEASELTAFLKGTYLNEGSDSLFRKAAQRFGIPEKYEDNFNRLHVSAQPPLLLHFYPEMLLLLKNLLIEGKQIFLLTKGNPFMQLNKLKYMDWQGIDKKIKVYFYDEIQLLSELEPLDHIIHENALSRDRTFFVGNNETDRLNAAKSAVPYIEAADLRTQNETT